MNRGISTVLLVGALLLVGCRGGRFQPSQPPGPPPTETNPSGFGLVIVTDTSGSMDDNDPRGFNKEGAHLAVGLTGDSDNLGLVSFASGIKLSRPLQVMRDPRARDEFSREVDGLRNREKTDFVKALTEATRLLDAPGLSEDAAVILLSDGEHNPSRDWRDVLENADELAAQDRAEIQRLATDLGQRGARVFTIALSEESDPTMLQQIAAGSGGGAFEVPRPEDLVDAYLQILGDVYGLFRYDRDPSSVKVTRTSRRLIYLLVKPSATSGVSLDGRIRQNGQAVNVSSRASYRRPPSPTATFDVAQFGGDLEGTWTVDLPTGSNGGQVIVLSNVPMTFQLLKGSPAPEVQVGHQVALGIEALCDDAAVARDAEQELIVTAQILAGDTAGPQVTLTPSRRGSTLTYQGSATAAFLNGQGQESEAQLVRYEIRLGDAGWVHNKTASFNVVAMREPPPAPTLEDGVLAVSTPEGRVGEDGTVRDDLGAFWEGEVDFSVPVDLRNDFSSPLEVSFQVEGAVAADAAPLTLQPGESRQVSVVPAGEPGAGRQTGRVVVSARSADADGSSTRTVDLRYDVYQVSVGAVKPASVAPGSEIELTVATAMGGPSGTAFELSAPAVESDVEGTEVTWPTSMDGALTVPVSTPALTPGGEVAARFNARPAGTTLEPRELRVAFQVEPSAPSLELDAPTTFTVSLSAPRSRGDWVTLEPSIGVRLEHHKGLTLLKSLDSLDGQGESFGNPDLQLVGNTALTPGEDAQVQLEVNLSANRNPGTYTGTLKLAVFDGDLRDSRDVEITVEIQP